MVQRICWVGMPGDHQGNALGAIRLDQETNMDLDEWSKELRRSVFHKGP